MLCCRNLIYHVMQTLLGQRAVKGVVGEGSLSFPMTFTHEFSRRSKEPCLESFIKAQYLLPCRLAHHPFKHKDRQGKRPYGVCIRIHLTQIATFLNKVYVVAENLYKM